MKTHKTMVAIALCLLAIAAAAGQTHVIPRSDDASRSDAAFPYPFRDADVRAAFPSLGASDKLQTLCINSVMGGATHIVFAAANSKNQVSVKDASCTSAEQGLICEDLRVRNAYYMDDPLHHFLLGKDVDFPTAHKILTLFKRSGIPDFPKDFLGRIDPSSVNLIEKTGDGYRLHLGEFYCAGCTSKFTVRIDGHGKASHLTLVGSPSGLCI